MQATLGELTPEHVKGTPYALLKAIDLLTHQAGLTPWIPFYKKTIENGALDQAIYSSEKKAGFERQVANGIYIKSDYWKTILERIVATPLSGQKKYEYSGGIISRKFSPTRSGSRCHFVLILNFRPKPRFVDWAARNGRSDFKKYEN